MRADSMIMSMMAALFIFGTVAISILMGVLKAVLRFDVGPLLLFAFLSFLILITIEGVLFSRLSRRDRRTPKEDDAVKLPYAASTKELESQSRIPLEPVSSVTDRYPQNLEPLPDFAESRRIVPLGCCRRHRAFRRCSGLY